MGSGEREGERKGGREGERGKNLSHVTKAIVIQFLNKENFFFKYPVK